MINTWYANALLIPPLTFGLVTRGQHLPLIESFLESPATHRQCAQTPSLRGGPFIDYRGSPSDIAELARATTEMCADQLMLADAVSRLHTRVHSEATGASLGALYTHMEPALRGCVEIAYDTLKQPGVRIIESAVYRRFPHHRRLQSCRLERVTTAERPFFLTTPLLARPEGAVDLRGDFSNATWDRLFRRDSADSFDDTIDQLRELLSEGQKDLPQLLELFHQPQL